MLCGQSEHLILFSSTDGENSHQVTKQFAHSHTGEERGVSNSSYVPFLFPLCILSISIGNLEVWVPVFCKRCKSKDLDLSDKFMVPCTLPVMELCLYFGHIEIHISIDFAKIMLMLQSRYLFLLGWS